MKIKRDREQQVGWEIEIRKEEVSKYRKRKIDGEERERGINVHKEGKRRQKEMRCRSKEKGRFKMKERGKKKDTV